MIIDSLLNQSLTDFGLTLSDRFGTKLLVANIKQEGRTWRLRAGVNTVTFCIHALHIVPGNYKIGLIIGNQEEVFDRIPDALQLDIISKDEPVPTDCHQLGFVTNSFEITQEE
jgi:hypothetical protein